MAGDHPGHDALERIDSLLTGRPKRDGTALKEAVQNLAVFRDLVVERHRAEGGSAWRPALERINAVISVVLAAQFPIGEVPWGELEKARGWLAEILEEAGDRGDQ